MHGVKLYTHLYTQCALFLLTMEADVNFSFPSLAHAVVTVANQQLLFFFSTVFSPLFSLQWSVRLFFFSTPMLFLRYTNINHASLLLWNNKSNVNGLSPKNSLEKNSW
jgi:hypothetical protein